MAKEQKKTKKKNTLLRRVRGDPFPEHLGSHSVSFPILTQYIYIPSSILPYSLHPSLPFPLPPSLPHLPQHLATSIPSQYHPNSYSYLTIHLRNASPLLRSTQAKNPKLQYAPFSSPLLPPKLLPHSTSPSHEDRKSKIQFFGECGVKVGNIPILLQNDR